jgi:hypothetical protein
MSNETLIFLIGAVPLVLEIFIIDPLFWTRGKNDKPWSTVIRVALVIALMFIVGAEIVLASLGWYCFFDNFIGLKKHGDPFYLGNSPWDQRLKWMPWYYLLGGRIIIASFFWGGYWTDYNFFTEIIQWLNTWM